jgi:Asp-tRNA(Asn)/Glu-tRNA(Gln) amidotransferase A subunit family amidase
LVALDRTSEASTPAGIAAAAATQNLTAPSLRSETLRAAEQIIGVSFTESEESMALPGVVQNLGSFSALRRLEIPLDTEPAITFRPPPPRSPARRPAKAKSPLKPSAAPRVHVSARIDDLAFEPVTVLATLLRRREVTSLDLTKMYLARLGAHADRLKCVVTLTKDLALSQASQADGDLKAGRYRGPLHGIPWGAKDLFATKGIKTTWGAAPFADQVIQQDATVVERLHAAGAVLLAKLSMGSLAQGGVWFGGTTRNPWNPDTESSGSSAGSCAATAAGLVGFALGTETRGSIITPASICGVVGLRPTYGRVSRHGAMALSWTMDKVGPICRTVEDCALVFDAIRGPDGHDQTVVEAPFDWNPTSRLRQLRVGYVASEVVGDGSNRGLSRALLIDSLDLFRGLGVTLVPIDLPDFPTDAINFILAAEAAAAFDDLTRGKGIDRLTEQDASAWPNSFRTSRFIPAVEYIRAQRARTLLIRAMEALMTSVDVFLAPARGSQSLPITNLTGHPAVCLKNGFVNGMPQALMVTGRLYDEATLLRVALAYERATSWHQMHPTLA